MDSEPTKQPVAGGVCYACREPVGKGPVECGECEDVRLRWAAAAKPEGASRADKTAFDSSAWLGISAHSKATIQKAAEGWGLQITYAQWTRIRRGKGVRLGGWAVEVRAADGTQREWAYGYTLAQLYDDMERAAVHCWKHENRHRAEMPRRLR
jgi:hypothetical protein